MRHPNVERENDENALYKHLNLLLRNYFSPIFLVFSAPTTQSEATTKAIVKPSQSSLFSAKSQLNDPVQDENNEDNAIDEEIDEFLNSSGPSASEDFTKDETISEEDSLRVDYKEAI